MFSCVFVYCDHFGGLKKKKFITWCAVPTSVVKINKVKVKVAILEMCIIVTFE